MQTNSMTMDDTIDVGTATIKTTAAADSSDDEHPPTANNSSKLSFSLYDDEDDVDMQTVKPAEILLKSLTPPISPKMR